MTRLLLASCLLALVSAAPTPVGAQAASPKLTVFKSPTCGCCAKWIEHMKKAGFDVTVNETPNVGEVKAEHHVPADVASCHTALVDGYIIEGHVPADAVLRLLKERPKVAGLAVPGMPIGSPGMEGDGSVVQHYDIVAFKRDGTHSVYESR
jgi:hypothetical protein